MGGSAGLEGAGRTAAGRPAEGVGVQRAASSRRQPEGEEVVGS